MHDDILSYSQLIGAGLGAKQVARLVNTGEMARLCRGHYVGLLPDNDIEQHRLLIRGVADGLEDDAVISHHSAAVLHGIPLLNCDLSRVATVRTRRGGGHRRTQLRSRGATVELSDVVLVDGLPVTSVARTAFDLAREHGVDMGVVATDAAARLGATESDWSRIAVHTKRWPGAPRARFAASFSNSASESPGESLLRLRFQQLGLPTPTLQVVVRDAEGRHLGRVDFLWEASNLVGEFDGVVKYGRLLQPGQDASAVIYAEKRREELICATGLWFVRFTWADLFKPSVIRARWNQASAVSTQLLR